MSSKIKTHTTMSRRKDGTFGKMIQINKPEDFSLVAKNGFFSMVYAPHEGRLIEYIPVDPADYGLTTPNLIAQLRFKDQKHQEKWVWIYSDDFELPEDRSAEQLKVLGGLIFDLAFTLEPRKALNLLNLIKLYSQGIGKEKFALKAVRTALRIRRKSLYSSSAL